jgi:phosphonate transport system substrate-binding protein
VAIVYITQIRQPAAENRELNNQLILQTVGLDTPVKNKLDARYSDANGDGIADTPSDPAKLLDPDVLTFSYVAGDDASGYADTFKEFVAFLGKTTGKKVQYTPFAGSDDELHALRDGKLHVVGLSTGNVPMAVDACGFVPIYMLANRDGSHMLQMEIIVRADSTMHSAQDLKGHELVLTEASSNAGFKAPLVLLRREPVGLEPGRDYATRYSNSYEHSIEGIVSGEYQAAAVANDKLRRLIAAGQVKPEMLRTIYKSPDFPSATFGYPCALKPALVAKVKEAFEKFDWKGTGLEKEFGEGGKFAPVNYLADFKVVREIDDAIGSHHVIADAK